jgi:hypothetical protein
VYFVRHDESCRCLCAAFFVRTSNAVIVILGDDEAVS